MNFRFHPEAEDEFVNAIEQYERMQDHLGYDFAVEVYSTIQRIIDFPEAWPSLHGNIRRSLVSRFPYGVLYSKENDHILILAVMHLHRDPDYWKSRD